MTELSCRQSRIWTYLSTAHQGRAHGVKWADLAEILAIPDRRLREAVATLVMLHGKPIGSHPRWGVYVCQDARDFALAKKCLADETWPTRRRMAALERIEWRILSKSATTQGTLFEGKSVVG